ncbi:RHS repeat-associated core domain-containing protein [Flavobacterium sp. N502540]|uniref:RHS repeat domain-containing protein n=1 Tax=Flavobacterium sp. N502540 TaxID=2986838 RepID=UPI0029CAC628|nr:RHS repeat-associated core domain-containing protein [Flavobacterium sp. N502540]
MEDYVEPSAGSYKYVYQYKDHLGNIRLSYAKNTITQVLTIIDENNYYPFGLKHKGYNDYVATSNKYKYNGKELQDELGLNMYDYGARNYDPALGRWMNIDPLAEEGRRWSPYNYALDNPVYFTDPDGMLSESFMKKLMNSTSGTTWTNNDNGTFTSSTTGETTSDGEGDPPSKKKPEDMTQAEKNEYWRKYNESQIPFARNLIDFALIADGIGGLSEFFTFKSSMNWSSITSMFSRSGVKIDEAVLKKFINHAFAKGRHNDLEMSVEKIVQKTSETVTKNFSKLKNGDNTLHVIINNVPKTIMVNVNNGAVRSINMYSGVSNRVTQGVVVNLGKVKW